ncbi:MAG: formylglycine-generating enzyme family protein [Magnetococcales bacterium]|nr:formylglycine-generating enzyme family protein [Magnetococcales bacterium]
MKLSGCFKMLGSGKSLARALSIAGGVALIMGSAGCGGGVSDSATTSTSTSSESATAYAGGTLIGATVCIDNNDDLACDSSTTTTTAADGSFTLATTGIILVRGGYDMDSVISGKSISGWDGTVKTASGFFNPFAGVIKAPSGSGAVTPMTSALQNMIVAGNTSTQAEANIKKLFGVTGSSVSLTGLSSLTDKTAMAGIESLGLMLRRITGVIAAAAGIDTSTTTLASLTASNADPSGTALDDMRKIYKGVVKAAATALSSRGASTSSGTGDYNFSSGTTANLTAFVSTVISSAVTGVAADISSSSKANLQALNPDGIAALAEDSIVQEAKDLASTVTAADFSSVTAGSTAGLNSVIGVLRGAGMGTLISSGDNAGTLAQLLYQPSDNTIKALITSSNLKGANSSTALDSSYRTKVKAIGTALAASAGKGGLNSTTVASALSSAKQQAVTASADTSNFSPSSGSLTFTNSLGVKFQKIMAGGFTMGSPTTESGRGSDEVQHAVTISKPFYLATTETTQKVWQTIMGSNPSFFSSCGSDCPVEQVTWSDVSAFITALNKQRPSGEGTYRLPTEAEWEYAARQGTTTAWSFGDGSSSLGTYAWFSDNSQSTTHPVGQKKADSWGFYDIYGNVLEWVQDWYGDYGTGAQTDPSGAATGVYRVARGGRWGDNPSNSRAAFRFSLAPAEKNPYLGFRLVMEVPSN